MTDKIITIEGDDSLRQQLLALDWDIEPERDLWPDISSRIRFAERRQDVEDTQSSGKRTWAPFAVAASAVLATVSLLFSSLAFQYAEDSKRAQEAMAFYQQAQLELIDQQHQMVRVQFVQLLNSERENLNPAFVSEVEMLMNQVDLASAELKKAIELQPQNTEFASMLVRTYQQEVKLLNQLKQRKGVSI